MNNQLYTVQVPSETLEDLQSVREKVSTSITAFDDMDFNTIVVVLVSSKNPDGTYTVNIGAANGTVIEMNFDSSFLSKAIFTKNKIEE